ncbi:GNAT family N-acetyltransferase [Paenibacillus psychroresistens]|uniref:GNAT family N-acetyltransferase n=1 Tax=Paenibacillus psychroresistens TaxID=1778678 RepID=A0A6B8RHJ3_9BACL|nr:GNAT family N-acetyltransferase [Paenibacillus psychroresistens]QGQ95022.1 GNAT family N-acetyltransferase [Paenibacillus psychroresistens]
MLQRYIRSDQDKLEYFMETMYVSRGYVFDPEGSHSDIRSIELLYFETGGGFWLLKEEQSVIGTIGLKGIDSENRIGEIKRFFVLPEYQDKGYGKNMMSQIIEFARQAGLIKLRLDTEKQSYKAMSVFRSFGFYEIPKYNDNDIAEIFLELSIVT